ncbi:hypothetical protein HF086_015505 [Spodoptera exigua]|uniref:Uncharacterized protein n=1 Tax=Spodoptera exigua TaxID=7107 RepID=A0A922SP90_SPOEX|nr:hypothetical protein HF086_015505 [Spodoptera exigua]
MKDFLPYVRRGGAFEGVEDQVSPFGYGRGEGVDAGHGDPEWICSKEKPRYDQIFQALNPIDGKVTGAGTQLPYMCPTQPRRRDAASYHFAVHKALDALLSTTQNCSLITDLCLQLKDRDDNHSHAQLVDSLFSATQNCQLITQFLLSLEAAAVPGGRDSPVVSIHSLADSLDVDASDKHDDESSRSRVQADDGRDDTDADTHTEWDSAPPSHANSAGPLWTTVRFLVLLTLNLVTLMITIEVLFISLVYVFTGERYLEFYVDRSPSTWLEKAKHVTFGLDQQPVRINSAAELFYRDNVANMLRYIVAKLTSTVPS